MGKRGNIFYALIIIWGLASCESASKRKSADYYLKNKDAITGIRKDYDRLYAQQPFSAGFTDKSFKYFAMEVSTDTLRSIFNTETSFDQLLGTILKFNYDTSMLVGMARKMHAIKCLWLDKSSFYVSGVKETVTFLSFKSASSDRPFEENKYYILLFPGRKFNDPDISSKVKKGEIVKVDEMVYFMIGNKFR